MADVKKNPQQLQALEEWMRAQKPEELFDADGKLVPELKELAPNGHAPDEREPARQRRTRSGRRCACPTSAATPWMSTSPGRSKRKTRRPLGAFLRDVMKRNMDRFRVFGPDENTSNKLQDIYEVEQEVLDRRVLPGRRRRRRTGAPTAE